MRQFTLSLCATAMSVLATMSHAEQVLDAHG